MRGPGDAVAKNRDSCPASTSQRAIVGRAASISDESHRAVLIDTARWQRGHSITWQTDGSLGVDQPSACGGKIYISRASIDIQSTGVARTSGDDTRRRRAVLISEDKICVRGPGRSCELRCGSARCYVIQEGDLLRTACAGIKD